MRHPLGTSIFRETQYRSTISANRNTKFIIENETGILCETSSKQSLIKGLRKLFSLNNLEMKQIGKKAFVHAQNTINLNPSQTILNDIISS